MELDDEIDEEESEMESDNEASNTAQMIIPVKRRRLQSTKRLKIPKFVNPLKQTAAPSTSTRKRRPEEVFDLRHADPRNRKIVMKPVELSSKLLKAVVQDKADETEIESTSKIIQPLIETQEPISSIPVTSENPQGFGLIFPSKKNENEEESDKSECITTEQLHENRISTNGKNNNFNLKIFLTKNYFLILSNITI